MKRLLEILLVLGLNTTAEAKLTGRYYMVVFASQGPTSRAIDSHTFASFWKGEEIELGNIYEPATISWLPATGVVRPLRREPGRNFSLMETLNLARSQGAHLTYYGPYEISPEFYQRALYRIRFLRSGSVQYKMINGPFAGNAINCIHALSGVVGELNTGAEWGPPASASVVRFFSRFIYFYPNVDREVWERLRFILR